MAGRRPRSRSLKPPSQRYLLLIQLENLSVDFQTAFLSQDKDMTSEELYCSICNLNFNSRPQAEQHYAGKNHARKAS